MPKPLPGPEYESPEFRRSPAYADFTAALESVECATYADVLAADRETRDRFHADWTARMQRRCGIDPARVTPDHRLALLPRLDTSPRDPDTRAERERIVRTMFAAGKSDAEMARVLGVKYQRVGQLRAKYGLVRPRPVAGPKDYRYDWYRLTPAQREARATALRLRTEDGLDFAGIAERLGVNTATAWKWVRDERARLWHKQQEAA